MPSLLRMPEVATDTPLATLSEWVVAENQPYTAHDTIATVETDKAVVDVEAEDDGVILKMLVSAGADVKVGEAIAVVGTPGETIDDLPTTLSELGVTPSGAEDGLEEPGSDDGGDVATAVEDAIPAAVVEAHTLAAPGGSAKKHDGRVFASPLARKRARDAGLDVDDIVGTGPNNRIVRRDVEAAIAERSQAATTAPEPVAEPAPEPVPAVAAGSLADEQEIPHSRMRKAIAMRLSESKQTVPHFYLRGAARVDELLELRARLNQDEPVRISVNDLVVKAVGRAHTLVPAMNVVWTPDSVRRFPTVDVAVAVDTDAGLVTPVVRGVDQLRLTAVAAATRDYAERARSNQLRQHEIEGGSITVSNLGMFGTTEFAAIINPPQAAILAVGAAVQEAVANDGQVVVATVMRLTLSVDHRPIDGSVAAEWMRTLVALLENPARILA